MEKAEARSKAMEYFDSYDSPTMRHTLRYIHKKIKYGGCYVVLPHEGGHYGSRKFFPYAQGGTMKRQTKTILGTLFREGLGALIELIRERRAERKRRRREG